MRTTTKQDKLMLKQLLSHTVLFESVLGVNSIVNAIIIILKLTEVMMMRVLLTCEAARRARHHARRARHARHRNFLNFYIYTFVKVILGNHFLINCQTRRPLTSVT